MQPYYLPERHSPGHQPTKFRIVSKRNTNNRNTSHERKTHNMMYMWRMVHELGQYPILNAKHLPNPRTGSAFSEKNSAHRKMLNNAIKNARQSTITRREIERSHLKYVLGYFVPGLTHALNVMTNDVLPSYVPNIRKNKKSVRSLIRRSD